MVAILTLAILFHPPPPLAAPRDGSRGGDSEAAAATPGARDFEPLLDRLAGDERRRAEARAAAAAEEERERLEREAAAEEKREGEAVAARAAARAFAERRDAMREWHASFTAAVGPALAERQRLYARLPHRLFARVRPQCQAVALAVEDAAAAYRSAPERRVDVLARDLLAVYRDSARRCADGAYFSFTVRESQVRDLVRELIAALRPFGLTFPRATSTSSGEGRVPPAGR